ncbi:MAG: PilN domain-containing protein [Candidatus Tectomicrobia bacterium]|nr:PilN domain-containing protein [Candidatus Tectomicrobia bacterium]
MSAGTCLTLEWRSDALVCGWVRGRSRVALHDYEVLPRPGAAAGSSPAAAPGTSATAGERSLADHLRSFIERQHGGGPQHVVLGIPRHVAIVQYVEVPASAAENLPQLMRFELERHLPFAPAEAYTDYCPVLQRNGNLLTLTLAVRKRDLDEMTGVLKQAGVEPTHIDLAASGLLRFWLATAANEEPVLLINLEAPGVAHGEVQEGAGGVPRADISIAHRRRLLACHAVRLDAGDPWSPLERELERVLLVARSTLGVPLVRQAVLHGPRGLREAVLPHLEQRYPGSVLTGMGPARLPDAVRRRPDYDPGMVHTVAGLAALAYDPQDPSCNLVPLEQRKKQSRVSMVSTVALLCLVLLLGGAYVAGGAVQQRRTLAELERQVKELRREVFEVRDLESKLQEQEKLLRQFEGMKEEAIVKLEILRELTVTIPKTAYIERLRYKSGRVEINGLAEAASNLIPTLEASPLFENVVFTAPITSSGGRENFQIRLDLER